MFFDTHNHFDDPVFDDDRLLLAQQAADIGIQQMVMTGITAETFGRMIRVQKQISQNQTVNNAPLSVHIALGLHPFFIKHHELDDLYTLEKQLQQHKVIALGEVGLDTFTPEMKQEQTLDKQKLFFQAQLSLAVQYHLPVLLHIRKAHADSLQILKAHPYNAHELGGIAHSFSGGEQEAKAFVKMGFKLGITGQVCNPNAKKLHKAIKSAVAEYGLTCLVVETDCPDMTPLPLQSKTHEKKTQRNTPANLIYVVDALSKLLDIDKEQLSKQLWQNSLDGLKLA